MTKLLYIIAGASITFTSFPASADEFVTVKELGGWCSSASPDANPHRCEAYIWGVWDGVQAERSSYGKKFCGPGAQIRQRVMGALKGEILIRSHLDMGAAKAIRFAIYDLWPDCMR